jgi:hypothetical protein
MFATGWDLTPLSFSSLSTTKLVHESFSLTYPGWMSTKHVRTAADLIRFKTALKIECTICGNSRTLSGVGVVKICGTQDLRSIQHRFKCSLCGAREASLTVLSPPAPRN